MEHVENPMPKTVQEAVDHMISALGRKLVVLVGTKKALAIAVKNNKTQMQYTRLKDRLLTLPPGNRQKSILDEVRRDCEKTEK
jgi:hypothetical protein